MRSLLALLCAAFSPLTVIAQPQFITSLYPPQHGLNIPADTVLHVGLQAPLDPASLSDSSIYVWSDITGLHRLTLTLENGNKDLLIVPRHWRLNDRPAFNAGERVTVTLTTRLRYANGRPFEGFTWHYTVAVRQNYGGSFEPEATFGGALSTYFNASDFNGDGWPDLVGNADIDYKMLVYLNNGRGILQFDHKDNPINPNGEVADLDRDGDQDITYGGDRLIFNDGNARFTETVFLDRPPGFLKAHDFNNDGIVDFAIGSVVSDTLYFGLSINGVAFRKLEKVKPPIPKPIFYFPGLSFDLNNDGRVDFLYVGGSIVSGTKVGFASFQAIAIDSLKVLQVHELPYEQINFYGNDFDRDGDTDYAFVPGEANRYITFFNDGTGQLSASRLQRDTTDNRLTETVEGGDFDGDGDIDLAFASSNVVSVMPEIYAPDISIFLNDGAGNFSLASRVRLPFDHHLFFSWVLRAVDLDRDGDLDLIGIAQGLFYVVANGSYATDVSDDHSHIIPLQFSIEPIYPNPVKSEANIELRLQKAMDEEIIVKIFDTTGRLVQSWRFDGREKSLRFSWNTRDKESNPVPSGVYFAQARTGKFSATRKLLLLH
jgi:hypothetical protein